MSAIKIIINGFSVCFELFILLKFYNIFLDKRHMNSIYCTLICITYLIANSTISAYSLLNKYKPYISFILDFILICIFSSNLISKLLLTTVIFTLFLSSECLIGMIIVFVLKVNIATTQTNIFLYLLAVVFSKLLVYIIVQGIEIKKKSKYNIVTAKSILPLVWLIISSCILTYVIFVMAYNLTDYIFVVPTILGILLFIFSNIATLYFLEKQIKMELDNQKIAFMKIQLDTQLKHYNELYENQKNTYKIYHDMNKQLSVVSGLLDSTDYYEATEYINKLVGNVNSLFNVVNTGYPMLDSIIGLNQAILEQEKISFSYRIKFENDIHIDKMDIAIIVGNALDNAIEACKQVENSNKSISLKIYQTEENLFISMENSTRNLDLNLKQHMESTKPNKKEHGFGLSNIKNIASNYNGQVEILYKDCVFSILVTLEK